MKKDILGKCGDGYVLKSKQKKAEPQKKKKKEKSKPKKVKQQEYREIACDYEQSREIFWPNLNKTLFTCVVNEHEIIDGENYKIFPNAEPYPIPLLESDSIQALSFVDNKNIKYLPVNIGESFPNIMIISASGNSIEKVSSENFKNMPQLKSLNLSGNRIKTLSSDTFENLDNLEELILENNEIETFEESFFITFKTLRRLRIKGNKVENLSPQIIESLSSLQELSFDFDEESLKEWSKRYPKLKFTSKDGEITEKLPESDPEEVTELVENSQVIEGIEEISEIDCIIVEYVSPETKEIMPTCEFDEVTVTKNKRFRIKPSTELSRVKRFSINGMKNVSYLPENLAESLSNLEEVSVIDSEISEVNNKNFKGMKNVKVINLQGNKIKHLPPDTFETLDSLENINLKQNNMEFIEETLFHYPTKLKKVNLADNRLHYLHQNTFRLSENLEEVQLEGNLISGMLLVLFL